jgi:hypothetical protein
MRRRHTQPIIAGKSEFDFGLGFHSLLGWVVYVAVQMVKYQACRCRSEEACFFLMLATRQQQQQQFSPAKHICMFILVRLDIVCTVQTADTTIQLLTNSILV